MASSTVDRREYKTVALPQTIRAPRRLGKSKGDRVAAAMSEIINREAKAGWSYSGSDQVRLQERVGLLGGKREASYTVLVFERPAPPADARIDPEIPAPSRRPVYAEAPDAGRESVRPSRRREPVDSPPIGRGAGRSAPHVEDAPPPRRRSRGYGFDEGPDLRAGGGLSARDDDDDGRSSRPMRRREARMAARRSAEEDRPGRLNGDHSDSEERFRGLVETMRQQRDRD